MRTSPSRGGASPVSRFPLPTATPTVLPSAFVTAARAAGKPPSTRLCAADSTCSFSAGEPDPVTAGDGISDVPGIDGSATATPGACSMRVPAPMTAATGSARDRSKKEPRGFCPPVASVAGPVSDAEVFVMFLMASASQHHPDLHPHRRNSVFCRENLSERIACASGVSGALGVVSQAQAGDRHAVNIQVRQSSHP